MSPCMIRILTPDGVQPATYTADSLADAAKHEPEDGVYTVANTFHTVQVLKFDAHLDRLEDSARRQNIPLTLERPRLRAALRDLIADAGYGDVRYRITVPKNNPDHLILSVEPFKPISGELILAGVRCVTFPNSARRGAAAKTTDWMRLRDTLTLPDRVYEGLLLNAQGDILEGKSSNFYAVLNGELRTAGEGVLPGIAQQIVFDIAPSVITLHQVAVNVRDLPQLSEAFITSSSRGIVPVVEIDGTTIGNGTPGAYTQLLREHYQSWVASHLENL